MRRRICVQFLIELLNGQAIGTGLHIRCRGVRFGSCCRTADAHPSWPSRVTCPSCQTVSYLFFPFSAMCLDSCVTVGERYAFFPDRLVFFAAFFAFFAMCLTPEKACVCFHIDCSILVAHVASGNSATPGLRATFRPGEYPDMNQMSNHPPAAARQAARSVVRHEMLVQFIRSDHRADPLDAAAIRLRWVVEIEMWLSDRYRQTPLWRLIPRPTDHRSSLGDFSRVIGTSICLSSREVTSSARDASALQTSFAPG